MARKARSFCLASAIGNRHRSGARDRRSKICHDIDLPRFIATERRLDRPRANSIESTRAHRELTFTKLAPFTALPESLLPPPQIWAVSDLRVGTRAAALLESLTPAYCGSLNARTRSQFQPSRWFLAGSPRLPEPFGAFVSRACPISGDSSRLAVPFDDDETAGRCLRIISGSAKRLRMRRRRKIPPGRHRSSFAGQ